MRRIAVLLVLAAVTAAFLFGCSKKEDTKQDEAEKQIKEESPVAKYADATVVVKVNGTEITRGKIDRERDRLLSQLRGRVNPQQLAAMRDTIDKQAVEKAVNRVLFEEVIGREGIKVSKEEVDSKINEIKGNFGSEELFVNQLKSAGMTEEEFVGEVEAGLNFEVLYDREAAKVKDATESDIQSYYKKNADQFKQPEQIKASHILVKVDRNADEAVKVEKKQHILDLLNQVREGANFAQLAALHSDCPSKSRGGDLGYFGRGQMVKPFEEAAFSLKIGDISDIVETDFGYHIIKLTDQKDAREIPLEEVKDRVKNVIEMERKQQAILDYINELRDAAEIEYIDSNLVN